MKKLSISKKLLALLLAFVMVIPGVYFGASDAEEVKAATGVSTDMLDIKVQVAVDGTDVIRVITSVDSLDYSKVGFELTTPSGTKTYETQTVYERIVSEVTDEEYEFSPKVVDTSAEYFVTAKFRATEGVDYTVKAFACAKGSTTKVYGPSRVIALGDASDNVINMMVGFATTANATYDVYDGSTKIGTAKVLADKNVRITLSSKKATDFPSATKFTFKSGSTSVGTEIYRNYYTKYTGDGTQDQTWYNVDTAATEFIIASSADIYGFALLVNAGTNFSGKTVIQIRDIEVNKGTASVSAWTPASGESTYEWVSIGDASKGFSGTFDGDKNTISGLYETKQIGTQNQRMGLFGTLNVNSLVKNVIVKNSFYSIPSGVNNTGGVVGYCQGNLENIYVDADVYLVSASSSTGGMCGMFSVTNTSYSNTFKNLWFAGTFTSSSNRVGSIIGRSYRGKVTLENCLFTGTVIGTTYAGGLVGSAEGSGADSGTTANYNRTTIKNSISAGTVKSASSTQVGSVVGGVNQTELKIVNVYTNDNRVYTGTGDGFSTTSDAVGFGSVASGSSTIAGIPAAFTTELNGTGAYLKTGFDFYSKDNEDGVWAAVAGKTPVLKAFAEDEVIDTLTGKRTAEGWFYNSYTKALSASELTQPSAAVFEIETAADLNGLAARSNGGATMTFKNQTIKLTADIDLNEGWKPEVDANGTIINATGVYEWIGLCGNANNKYFMGTFDGQGHTISGIYMNTDNAMTGFIRGTDSMSLVKDVKIVDSYIKNSMPNSNKLYDVGSLIGYCFGDVSDIYSSAIVAGDTWATGGIVGRLRSAAANPEAIAENCWFDGEVYVTGTTVSQAYPLDGANGGIVGRAQSGTVKFIDCLNTGKIIKNVATLNTAKKITLGGIVGDDYNGGAALTLENCLNVGSIIDSSNDATKYAGGLIGATSKNCTITDSYSVTDACDKAVGFVKTGIQVNGGTYSEATYEVTRNSILLDAAKTGAPGLFEDGDVWAFDTESGERRGTPILESFSTWWQETMFDDGVLNVLLIGNSFCYYHTDELYGMIEADGVKTVVANVYDSGCTVQEHVQFLNNNTKRYQYIAISNEGKTSVSSQTMVQCLEAEDWDVISFQQHFDPSEAMDYTTASGLTLSYAKTLYDYLKANYSDARLLWQMTWAYQVGYIGHGGLTDEQKEAQDAKYKVLDTAKQTLNYENISAVARAVCEQNDVELVPNGDAWQLARATVGDILCDKSGTDLAADTKKSDNYHDGDVGGGQFLNACGWYEVITGRDCRNNTFTPSYSLLINTEFNSELTTQADVIAALKEAAHTAVMNSR